MPATSQNRHVTPRVVFDLPQELLDVVDAEADDNDRTRTAEIVRTLKWAYQQQGKWPAPKAGEEN